MGKRASNKACAKSPKKARTDPVLANISDSIMQAEDLPETCRTMVIEALPYSLSVPSDKRHELQTAIVDMAKQVLEGKKSTMEAGVASEKETMASLQASREGLSKAVEEAEVALASQKEAVLSAKTLLADTQIAVKANTKSLDELRAEHKASTDKLGAVQAEKLALESVFENHFKPMKEGTPESHFKELEPHLQHLELESSLLLAVPSSCAKPKEERGSFDAVVLDELEKALSSKIGALGETVTAEIKVSEERESAKLAAQEKHDAVKDTQKRVVADFEAARKEENDGQAVVDKAKTAVDELQPNIDAAGDRLQKVKLTLEGFEAGTLGPFLTFSTLTSEATVEVNPEAAPSGA